MSQVRKITFKQILQAFQYFLKHWNNTSTICLKIVLRTRDIFRWGFPDSSLRLGHYIQPVVFFLVIICSAAYTASEFVLFQDDTHVISTPIFAYFLRILRMSR